jgi:hypothetical protein
MGVAKAKADVSLAKRPALMVLHHMEVEGKNITAW